MSDDLSDVDALYEDIRASGAVPVVPGGSDGGRAGELRQWWDAGEDIARMVAVEDTPRGMRESVVLSVASEHGGAGRHLGAGDEGG